MTMLNEHLEHHVNQKLLANDELSSQRIEVKANNGQVILSGEVQSFRRKLTAQELAEADEQVHSVVNNIIVATPEDLDVAMICNHVNDRLDQAIDLSSHSIRVSCKAGSVSLTGYVKTEEEKLRAADIAASVDGVSEVNNFLISNPDQVSANQAHCRKILDSMLETIGMENEPIRLSVVDETARLSGEVDEIWKKESAQKIVSQFGILNIVNDIVVKSENQL